jgi:hypothetical protein
MADVTVKIITPAISFAFMTLAELKVALGSPVGTPSSDAQWQFLIEANSQTIAELCQRTFAREEVEESWREIINNRIHLTHWPVKKADIQSVSSNGVDQLDWELEEASGKLQFFDQSEPITVHYTGGYVLPEEAPVPLKHATVLMSANWKAQLQMVQVTGVRMLSHKDSRVMFHTPPTANTTGSAASATGLPPAVEAILSIYTRFWS